MSLSPKESSLGLVTQARKGVSGVPEGGVGWGPIGGKGEAGASVPLHPCPAPTPSGSQAPVNEDSLALGGLCNFSANLGFFVLKA